YDIGGGQFPEQSYQLELSRRQCRRSVEPHGGALRKKAVLARKGFSCLVLGTAHFGPHPKPPRKHLLDRVRVKGSLVLYLPPQLCRYFLKRRKMIAALDQ